LFFAQKSGVNKLQAEVHEKVKIVANFDPLNSY